MRLELPDPISANLYWRHFRGRTVISPEAREYKQTVAKLALVQGIKSPIQGEVKVVMVYHPRSRKRETKSPLRRLDLGNIEKVTSDALNGIAWLDDYQIVDLRLILGTPIPGGKLVVEWEST